MSFSSNFAVNKLNKKRELKDKYCCLLCVLFMAAFWGSLIYWAVTIYTK